MGQLRRIVLTALPKLLISRATRLLANIPLPRALRGPIYGVYARRYGADLDEMGATLADYRSMAAFFQRTLRDGARAVDPGAALVWPADGKLVAAGPIAGDRLPQIKGIDYAIAELVADPALAAKLAGGSQATVYLAPGDYHRVHSPCTGRVVGCRHVPGGLFPVNPGAVTSIPGLFARNERRVLEYELPDGRAAAVVMVAALNVSDTVVTCPIPGDVAAGDDIGSFGLGSTVVALIAPGDPSFAETAPETVVRVGQRADG